MSLVSEFDVYSNVLNYGNRSDIEDGDWGESGYDYASWEANLMPDLDARTGNAILEVYSDTEKRQFLITWEEIHD